MKKETAAEKFNSIEEFTILEECRVLESGKKFAVKKKVGETAMVEANDKVALIATGKGVATKDLTDAHKAMLANMGVKTVKK